MYTEEIKNPMDSSLSKLMFATIDNKPRILEKRKGFSTDYKDRSRRKSLSVKIEQHTTIFASMCPDEILDHYDDYETRSYYTTLMLGDVSGFTDLTEKYTKSGKGGPSKLSEILNTYIGSMVQEILSHRGDVLKFSGDAFIVMWKLQEGMVMRDIAIEAMQTACVIQKHFGTYETDVGVTLKVKLAIASGKTSFTSIGNPKLSSHYIITGKPVWDVKYAEGLCKGGDIIVAPSCWQWANPNEYIYEKLQDGIHTLILASSILYDTTTKEDFKVTESSDIDEISGLHFTQKGHNFSESEDDYSPEIDQRNSALYQQIDYSLRPKMIKAVKARIKNALRSYTLRPVVRSVELDEPIEYLTEMRQVVIVFVNIVTQNLDKKRLIRLVNYGYNLICGIVREMQGCVNKTSLFDKDLMFLVIFGLRGGKHELESQIGLRCASIIRKALSKSKNIRSVSVGVTTGITYCGVVGHILRREYTVIGLSVNKAARLMCAYTDKVVCDRDSFLQSHLGARHFVLQESKFLKGITNVGPVYEFLEQEQLSKSELMLSKYPILGRDSELTIFQNLLQNIIKARSERKRDINVRPKESVLIIRGVPRIGKTRLMDQFTQLVPSSVSMNFISLISSDGQIPYRLLHFIFCAPIGFSDKSTVKERTDKLLDHLGNSKETEYFCVLNEPFNVDFKVSSQYRALRIREKHHKLRRLLVRLMYSCFHRLWIILIDDIEYADGESISLLNTLVKLDLVLFVISLGQKVAKAYSLHKEILQRAKVIDLKGVNKWFHAGLVCQFLNCQAIPAELEKIIQEKSTGNPGWIESYLISVQQSKGLSLETVSKEKIINMGLVVPPREMLITPKLTETSQGLADQVNRFDLWKMYRYTYKESDLEVEKAKLLLTNDLGDEITICILTKNFDSEELEAEVTMDVIILKLFDSLNSLDQLLLKCAAVLGETVDRKMMESLMQGISEREIAVTVTKLFEMKLLGCARGDFNRSPGALIYFRNLRNSNVGVEVRCGCVGVKTEEFFSDLPEYASCQLMRFKMTMFRETTYRLLTKNQKVDFHNKALKYLQNTTRRCVSCGQGAFVKLLGKTIVEEKIHRKTLDAIDNVLDMSFFSDTFYEADGISTIREDVTTCLEHCRRVNQVPTRSFSQMDFSNCECKMILLTVYAQMVEHCRAIGVDDKLLTVILEFTDVCISTCNIPQARKLLTESEQILKQMQGTIEDELITLPYLKGKIYTSQGRCFLESGLLYEAENCFYQTVKAMGYNFPKSKIMIKIKSAILLKHLNQMLTWCRPCKVGIMTGLDAEYVDQFANCLAQLFTIFRMKGMNEHAHLASIWGLCVALESSKNFFVLCTAYSNMMITAHILELGTKISYLENDGIRICSQRKEALELEELQAVGELYSGIFFSRWLRGNTSKAASIGFLANRIASTVRSTTLQFMLLPRLIHVMLANSQHDEAIYLLQELEFIANGDMDKSGRTWYYALCIDVLLECGITIIPFHKCEQFYQEESDTMLNLRDPEAGRRFFICMWLFYVRIGDWETATMWKNRKVNVDIELDKHTVVTTITILKKLEGLLIFYVHKVDNRNAEAAAETLAEIQEKFNIIKKLLSVVKVISCRYYLMKAYYYMVRIRTKKAFKFLNKSKKVSRKFQIQMMYRWADHNEKAWAGSLSEVQRDFWKNERSAGSILDWHEVALKRTEILPYTLPLPKSMQ